MGPRLPVAGLFVLASRAKAAARAAGVLRAALPMLVAPLALP